MKNATLGACAGKLRDGGYTPLSAIAPRGEWLSNSPPHFAALPDYLTSEHPAAVACRGAANLVALVVLPGHDGELAERIRGVLDTHKLTTGPCRIGSDGSELYPLKAGVLPPCSWVGLGVLFEHAYRAGPFDEPQPRLIPLDGTWRAGDLLTVPRAALPAIDSDGIDGIIAELAALPGKIETAHRAPPQPTLEAWLG